MVFRISNAVGSPLHKNTNCWNLVANDLCKQTVINNKMLIKSNKFIQRDYIPISMICDITHQFITGKCVSTSGENIFNISSGISMGLNDLTQLISDLAFELFNKKPAVEFLGNNSKVNIELSISRSKLNMNKCLADVDIYDEIKELLLNCKRWFVSDNKK